MSVVDPCSTCTAEGADVLLVLMWMSVLAVSVAYGIGVWGFADAVKEDVSLRQPDRTFAAWAIAIWWPVFGFFRLVEFLAKVWRTKEWP